MIVSNTKSCAIVFLVAFVCITKGFAIACVFFSPSGHCFWTDRQKHFSELPFCFCFRHVRSISDLLSLRVMQKPLQLPFLPIFLLLDTVYGRSYKSFYGCFIDHYPENPRPVLEKLHCTH